MANDQDYVDLGLSCADACKPLTKGIDGKSLDELSRSVRDAIYQLTTWVEQVMRISCPSAYYGLDRRTVSKIQEKVLERSGRGSVSRFLRSRSDKEAIAAWKSDLNRILLVFNVRSTHSRFVVANHSILRRSLSSILTHSLPTYVGTGRNSTGGLATCVRR